MSATAASLPRWSGCVVECARDVIHIEFDRGFDVDVDVIEFTVVNVKRETHSSVVGGKRAQRATQPTCSQPWYATIIFLQQYKQARAKPDQQRAASDAWRSETRADVPQNLKSGRVYLCIMQPHLCFIHWLVWCAAGSSLGTFGALRLVPLRPSLASVVHYVMVRQSNK